MIEHSLSDCPPEHRLAELLTDRVEAAERAGLEDHLERCPNCVRRLQELAGDSAEWGALEKCLRNDSACWDRTADLDPDRSDVTAWPVIRGYEIQREIGRGGMGIVYKARQSSLGRSVALKVMRAAREADPEYRRRFRLEAELVAGMRHPNVIHVYEFNEFAEGMYLALEYVSRGSLSVRLRELTLPAAEAARLVEVIARAVHTAHQAGIIHRDLKPANVLLAAPEEGISREAVVEHGSERYVPKVTDFGLARRIESAGDTRTGMLMGTPGYMAPEQVQGTEGWNTPLVDVYALGAVLHECLTGRPPFRAESPYETLRLVVQDEPMPLTRLAPTVPRDLETICLKCLRKNPAERYGSAAELADDLLRFRTGESIAARPVPLWVRAWKWARRHPVPAAAGLVALAAVITLLTVWAQFTARLQGITKELQTQSVLAREGQTEAERAREQSDLRSRKEEVNLLMSEKLLREQVEVIASESALKDPGLLPVRQRLVRNLLERHARLIGLYPNRGQMVRARARSYHWVGKMTMVWGKPETGAYHLWQAAEIGTIARDLEFGSSAGPGELALTFFALGQAQVVLGDYRKAENSFRRAVELVRSQRKRTPDDALLPLFEARVLAELADALVCEQPSLTAEAARLLEEARELAGSYEPPDRSYPRPEIAIELAAARLESRNGNPDGARQAYAKAISLCQDTEEEANEQRLRLKALAEAHTRWGELELAEGNVSASLEYARTAVPAWERLVDEYPQAHGYRHGLSRARVAIANLRGQQKEFPEAAAAYRQALRVQSDLILQMPDIWDYAKEYGETVLALAEVSADPGELPERLDAALSAARPWVDNPATRDEALRLIRSLDDARPPG